MIGIDDNGESFDLSLITGKALEKYFELQDALFEFSKLFKSEEENDRAIAIVGAAFLDTLLEHILIINRKPPNLHLRAIYLSIINFN